MMFVRQSDIKTFLNKTAGKLATEVRTGDAPKPIFSMKTNKTFESSGNQDQINHRNWSLFLSLHKYMVGDLNAWWGTRIHGGEPNYLMAWSAFKNKTAGMLVTESQSGDAPKPQFLNENPSQI